MINIKKGHIIMIINELELSDAFLKRRFQPEVQQDFGLLVIDLIIPKAN